MQAPEDRIFFHKASDSPFQRTRQEPFSADSEAADSILSCLDRLAKEVADAWRWNDKSTLGTRPSLLAQN